MTEATWQARHSTLYNGEVRELEGFPGGSVVKIRLSKQEMCVQSLSPEDSQEKEMPAHSNILVQRLAWTEEPRALQSMGSQRGRHD